VVRVFSEDADEYCEMHDTQSPTGDKSNVQEYVAEGTHETDIHRYCAAEYSLANT